MEPDRHVLEPLAKTAVLIAGADASYSVEYESYGDGGGGGVLKSSVFRCFLALEISFPTVCILFRCELSKGNRNFLHA